MKKIIYSTGNKYKIKFANNILKRYGVECDGVKLDLAEPQSLTQEEISEIKVREAYETTKKPTVCMDSGFFINCLNGFPGIYTSDMFKMLEDEDFIRLVDTRKDRSAYIQQTVAYFDGKNLKIFSTKAKGHVVSISEMKDGYDFDSFFKADKFNKLFAEMTENEKAKVWGTSWHDLGKFLADQT